MNECDIFMAVLDIDSPEERGAYLDKACGKDTVLRQRVDTLLDSHAKSGSLLEHPAAGMVDTQFLEDTENLAKLQSDEGCTAPGLDQVPLDFLEPSDQPDSLGRLGQYDVREVVGRGGMGIVLKAHDTKLSRVVAVKVLAPELAANATARKRFLREARAAAAVSHDHVVTIYAVEENEPSKDSRPGTREDLPFLVMEFIDGPSLEQKIDQDGRLELKEILRIGRQVAAGLEAAHQEGLIHRDIKASNILLQDSVERVRIMDFGLARAIDDASITRTGEVAGTPQYMSPEQAQGQPVDARSDLFSFGSMLYAMCTGRSPFWAETTMASLRRVCDDTPRAIREITPDVPEWLVAITDRLLEKNRDDRFQSAEEVCHLLDECLAHVQDPAVNQLPVSLAAQDAAKRKTSSAKPATSAPDRRWAVAAALLIGILALATLSEATGVTNLTASVIRIAMNRGQLVIESSDPNIEIKVLQGGELVRIVMPGTGQSIDLTAGEYQIQLAGAAGGWSLSTDRFTLIRGGREIVKVWRQAGDGASGEEVVKVRRQGGDGPSGGGMMEWLRQGSAQNATETERLGIYVIDVTTGEVILVRDKPIGDLTYFGSPSWSNDGQRILFDVSPGKAFGKTRLKLFRVVERTAEIKDLGLGNCPTLSPDGGRVAFLLNPGVVPDAPRGIWLMRADGSERRHLGGYGVPKWSPDGKQLLIVSFSSPCHLSIMDVETAKQRPVQLAGHNFYSNPGWAGDGQTIVAIFTSGSDAGIALVDVTDPEQAQVKQILWTRGDGIDVSPLYPVYSPKTDLCVFVGGDQNGEALYTVKPGQSDPPKRLEPTRYDVKLARLSFSSDGRYVLFCNDRLNQLSERGRTTAPEVTESE